MKTVILCLSVLTFTFDHLHASAGDQATGHPITAVRGAVTLTIDFTSAYPTAIIEPANPFSFDSLGYSLLQPLVFTSDSIKFFLPKKGQPQTISLETLCRYLRRKQVTETGSPAEREILARMTRQETHRGLTPCKKALLEENIRQAFGTYFQGQETIDHEQLVFNQASLFQMRRSDGSYHLVLGPLGLQ